MSKVETRVFEDALASAKRIEHAFPNELASAIDVNAMAKFELESLPRLREMMVKANEPTRRLFKIAEEAATSLAQAQELLRRGDVAAVDGTDAMEQISFMSTSASACAVGYVTAKERGKPVVRVAVTSTRYQSRKEPDLDEMAALCDELEDGRIEQSWPITFREYQEREMAIDCGAPWVFVDGPVYTQNLVTQVKGRELYQKMGRSGQRYIGIIKDLSGSWVLSKWCAYALEPGEGFIVAPVGAQFEKRLKKRGFDEWFGEIQDYVRVVFRPSQKAFGLECRLGDLPMAIALVVVDSSPTINHELPLLLETIDAHMRAGCRAGDLKAAVISRIQQSNYRAGVDLRSERDFR